MNEISWHEVMDRGDSDDTDGNMTIVMVTMVRVTATVNKDVEQDGFQRLPSGLFPFTRGMFWNGVATDDIDLFPLWPYIFYHLFFNIL